MIQIQYLSEPPKLAADLSGDAWANLAWHDNFTIPGSANAELVPGTSFAMVHDGDSLYIAMKCGVCPGSSAENFSHERVHVVIDFDRDGRWGGKFIGNADGLLSATMAFRSGSKDSWPGEVEFEVKVGAQEWTAAMKIPLRQLGYQQGGLRRVRFNIARLNAVPEFWVCFPALAEKTFWEPQCEMAEAEFERPEL